MNMIFELIGLLLVVGCAFFTTFFLAAVAGTMVVILAGSHRNGRHPLLCKQGGSEKSEDSTRQDHDLSHTGVSNLRKPLHHLAD